MPVEIRGQQLRIRVRSPKGVVEWGTQDVGRKGKLQRIAGYYPKKGWLTQSWRLNLSTYRNEKDAILDLNRIYRSKSITRRQYSYARNLIKRWFRKR